MSSEKDEPKAKGTETLTPASEGARDLLKRYFEAAQASATPVEDDLRARILADAGAAMRLQREPDSALTRLRRWLSGWAAPGLAGGAMAALAGFWIGLTLPMPVVALDAPFWMEEALSYMDFVSMTLIGLDDPLLMGFER